MPTARKTNLQAKKPKTVQPRKKPANRKSSSRRLLSSAAAEERPYRVVRTSSLNAIIGVFMLPIAGLLTQTFFGSFSHTSEEHPFWLNQEFWFFGLGAVLWIGWFFGSIATLGEPRPLRLYVFGHELTHAIWVWLMGGRVREFNVRRDGGYILTDMNNFWISLAPYFYPIYSIAVIIFYGVASLFYNLGGPHMSLLWVTPIQVLFLAIGITWGFHLSFTCWMIPKGQSDLRYHGTFFSLVVIYIMNIAVLSLFLVVAAPEITWSRFGNDLLENTENFSATACSLFFQALRLAKSF